MLGTSARLLELLSLLHSRRFWTGPELATILEITPRSVRRDIDKLRELGHPVHAASGVGGGYSLGAGSELPPLPLDDEEAVAVAVGLRAAATGVVTGLEEASVRALTKLERVLPKRLRHRVTALNAVSVGLPVRGPKVSGEVLSHLAAACQDGCIVGFDYGDRAGNTRRRRVEPHRLVHTQHRWYLLAFDLDRDDWRTFRLDRLAPGLPERGVRYRPRELPGDDVRAWVGQTTGAERYAVRVMVQASAEAVVAHTDERWVRVEPVDEGCCVVHTRGDDLGWIAFYLGMFPFEMEIQEPPELIDHIREQAARMLRAVDPSRGASDR